MRPDRLRNRGLERASKSTAFPSTDATKHETLRKLGNDPRLYLFVFAEPRLGRRMLLTFPLFPPPQKN